MRVLVIGAYGFIGSAIVSSLTNAGHAVIPIGRSVRLGRRLLPDLAWVEADLNYLTEARAWLPMLEGVETVVNASGGLQSNARDRLERTQGDAIVALIAACEQAGVRNFIQISAVGAQAGATTDFMRSKALADARLAASSLVWTILRPGLVIGRNSYGGTALIRMLAALPLAVTVHGDRLVQCVALDDVTAAVLAAVAGRLPGADIDLVERTPHRLRDVVAAHRRWLGLTPARGAIDLPPAVARPIAVVADLFGWLGWRSPLRSTALRVIGEDVVGDDATARRVMGGELADLDHILAAMPAGLQDRWHARLGLLLPLVVCALAALWIGSGVGGFATTEQAARILPFSAAHPRAARDLVLALALLDVALGLAILVRRWAQATALGMALATLVYLAGGTLLAPGLWSDPLGPLLKAIPALALALVAAAILDER